MARSAVVAPKEYPEVLLMAPNDPKDITFERTLDMMVEYGMYVDSDENDNLPMRLPADLSHYKAIVADDATPAAQELKAEKYDSIRDKIRYYRKPKEFAWNDERPMYVLVQTLLMRHGVRTQNPLFLKRNSSRRDKDAILGQCRACIKNQPMWIRYGNDVSHTWLEGMWASAKFYRDKDLQEQVIQIIYDMLDRDKNETDPKERYKHYIFGNACLLLPMWKDTGIKRFLEAGMMKMKPLKDCRRIGKEWRKGTPYMRAETMSGSPWLWAMRAAYFKEPDFYQPAVDAMVAGIEALFDRRKNLFAHYGIKGSRQGLTWGRGQGWALYGLVGLLEFLPKDHPEYESIRIYLDREAEGLRRTQDAATGLWNHVMGEPTTRLEVSGTAMTTRHISRAWRMGLTRMDFIPDMLARAWDGLKAHTFQHRTCTFAWGTGEGYDVPFYSTVPCGGSSSYTFIAGGDYVTTFGEHVK